MVLSEHFKLLPQAQNAIIHRKQTTRICCYGCCWITSKKSQNHRYIPVTTNSHSKLKLAISTLHSIATHVTTLSMNHRVIDYSISGYLLGNNESELECVFVCSVVSANKQPNWGLNSTNFTRLYSYVDKHHKKLGHFCTAANVRT